MNVKITFLLRCLIIALIILNGREISAQIAITPNATANVLISRLVGVGITYTNPVLTCPLNGSGKFDNGLASSVLIDSGVVLTTGRAQTSGTAFGVNGLGSDFASVNNNTNGGDANLATAAGTTTSNIHDLCKLEFDFIPTGDTIQFNYRFGSEEYPIYNCSQYNDIFAFFLSGPGYATPTNVALVPGTSIPVTINSINNGTISSTGGGVLTNCTSLGTGSPFTSLYVNNSASTTITYNGLTSLLTAKAAVTPCSTYHMKFAIGDVTDHVYDSGVFLQAGSFVSDIATVTNVTSSNTISSGNPFAIEGCSPAVITITRPQAKPYPQTVTYSMSGTATNGLDFTALSGSAVIPANAISTTITVTALQDGIIEGPETLILSINGSICGGAVTETLTVDILEYPTFAKSLNDTICNGQTIPLSATPAPANPNLTFSWSPASSLSNASGSNVTASPSTTTTYTITSSYPGCPSVDSTITISVDPTPVLSLTHTNITCNGLTNGSITATGTASLPMTFTLNPTGVSGTTSPFTFTNLPANTYTVTISSSIGCTKTMTASITSPTLLAWTNAQTVNPMCNGSTNGSITLSSAGGTGTITYTLLPNTVSNTTGSFPSLSAGSYTVNAVDANGCSLSTIVALTANNAVSWTLASSTNVMPCFGNANGAIHVAASGGTGFLTYTSSPSGGTNTTGLYTGLTAGVYTVLVSDVNGCSNATSVTITQPTAVHVNSVLTVPVVCHGNSTGSVTINSSGGTGVIQYTLMPGSIVSGSGLFSNLAAGVYTIISTDASGCTVTTSATMTQPAALLFTTFTSSPVSCNGGNTGSIHAVATGGTGVLNYILMPSGTVSLSGNFVSLGAGTYTVQAIDANGCTATSATTITQPAPLTLGVPVLTQVNCHGSSTGSIHITASGGTGTIVYDLNAGASTNITGIFNALSAGIYTVEVSDAAGCTNTTVIMMTEPTALQFNTVTITNPPCSNINTGVINMTASGGSPSYLYALNAGAFSTVNSFNNLAAGVYAIHIKDSKGCLKDSVVTLVPTNSLSFTNVSTQNVHCKYDHTGFITLQTSGGVSPYSYQLNGSPTGTNSNFLNVQAGVYSIHVADMLGCVKDTVITITEPAIALNFNSLTLTHIKCFGDQTGQINASASGGTAPYQYARNGGAFQTSGLFTSLSVGTYTISVKDFYGCQKDSIVHVLQPAAPLAIRLNRKKEITCIGLTDGSLQMGATGGVKPYTYTINGGPAVVDSNFLQLSAGNYVIEVTDSNGCKSSASFVIAVPTKRPYVHIDNLVENLCNGDNIGMIDWSGINGFAPYTYIVNGNLLDTVSKLNNLVSGNYLIQLTDSAGCKNDTTIIIVNSTTLAASVETVGASCTGDGKDGKATASVIGGVQPYQYKWLGYSDTSSVLENVSYGNQILVVQDNEGCTDTVRYVVDYFPCCDLYMPNAFSPNNDGHNDVYRIIHYGVINLKSFEIYDRWGHQVFITNSMDGAWDGKFQGSDYEIGTYYYLVRYYCQLSTKLNIKKGDFTLLR